MARNVAGTRQGGAQNGQKSPPRSANRNLTSLAGLSANAARGMRILSWPGSGARAALRTRHRREKRFPLKVIPGIKHRCSGPPGTGESALIHSPEVIRNAWTSLSITSRKFLSPRISTNSAAICVESKRREGRRCLAREYAAARILGVHVVRAGRRADRRSAAVGSLTAYPCQRRIATVAAAATPSTMVYRSHSVIACERAVRHSVHLP